jgi:hypothetical protein
MRLPCGRESDKDFENRSNLAQQTMNISYWGNHYQANIRLNETMKLPDEPSISLPPSFAPAERRACGASSIG